MLSRRSLLAGSALGAAGTALIMRPASALTFQDVPPTSGIGLALSNHCGGETEHAQLAADLRARLSSEGASPGTSATATCPICGCPVTVYACG